MLSGLKRARVETLRPDGPQVRNDGPMENKAMVEKKE